jgi:predicted nucleotide-binding protein (sugar kinase/HSP70/actin superfamily)
MTKVEAIRKVMEANGGTATLSQIYKQVKKYKEDIDQAADWKAGLRGVLYREVRNNKTFKKVHESTYGLK